MKNSNFRPSKALGQNFLTDENITKKIVRLSGIDETCSVLEIGPGFGALTKILAETALYVTAVELDSRLAQQLEEKFAINLNVNIIQGDILKQDLGTLIEDGLPGDNRHVCANLPYNITTPVITRLCECRLFKTITVMVQKEVALRMCAAPGTPDYGAFSVFTQYHAQPQILFDIPPECFTPRPKVTSSVVKLAMHDVPLPDTQAEKNFFRVVRASFGQRRKTLINALYSDFGQTHSKETIAEAVINAGFDVKCRGETLSPYDFIKLSLKL